MSSDIASTSLRKFSACFVRSTAARGRVSFGDAVHQPRDLLAEARSSSARPDLVSSATSCSRAVATEALSSRYCARMCATATGWVM
jgi:hypothetical protein